MSAELSRSFLLRVLLPGLLSWVLYRIAQALPRPTDYDLPFYLAAIGCGVLCFLGGILWTARFLAVSLGLVKPEAPADPTIVGALLQHSVQRKLAEAVVRPHESSQSLAYYADGCHRLEVMRDQNQLVLLFSDGDRDEPLRPQVFALNHRRLSQVLEKFAQGQAYLLTEGRHELSLSSVQADTEDGHGPHFGVALPERFTQLLREQLTQIPPPPPPQEELQSLLDDLQTGRRLRFDPAVVAGLADLRDQAQLDPLLLPHLSGNPDQVLFAVAFLFSRSQSKADLVEPLLHLVETLSPGPHREAAEGSLVACLKSNPELASAELTARVFARIPWDQGAQSICSCLRILQAVGPLSQPHHPELRKRLEAWQVNPGSRLDWGNTSSTIESILEGK